MLSMCIYIRCCCYYYRCGKVEKLYNLLKTKKKISTGTVDNSCGNVDKWVWKSGKLFSHVDMWKKLWKSYPHIHNPVDNI